MTVRARIYRRLSGAGAGADAADPVPGNWLRHAGALGLSKSADGLADPKLVLSWLLTALAVPAFLVGLLVPLREAGALLPQLFVAPRIRAMARRKWAWAGAAVVQGLMLAAIVAAALGLRGVAAGLAILSALAILALARSVASVSYKDVLARTVPQARRGAATGLAASVASLVVLGFAVVLMAAPVPRMALVLGALSLAAAALLLAARVFAGLVEEPGPDAAAGPAPGAVPRQVRELWRAPVLGRFVLARGLLVSTALAPPYLVLLSAEAGHAAFERLGALVLASALASLLSSYVWGRLADRSSRLVLILSGLGGAAALCLALGLRAAGLAGTLWALPLALFALMIAYHGIRQGRAIYLTDIAPGDARLAWTAVANTAIGLVLLGAGLIGALAAVAGAPAALGLFAAMAAAGAAVAHGLPEADQ